jgi:hypothetical protein
MGAKTKACAAAAAQEGRHRSRSGRRDGIGGSSTSAMAERRGFDENDLQTCTGSANRNELDERNALVSSPSVRDEQWRQKGSPELERRSPSSFFFNRAGGGELVSGHCDGPGSGSSVGAAARARPARQALAETPRARSGARPARPWRPG